MDPQETKICAICLGSIEAGKGQAIFTAECRHLFHFGCISNNITHGNHNCPICRAPWNDLPFIRPASNARNFDLSLDSIVVNDNMRMPVHSPVVQTEPVEFNDDEPLPNADIATRLQCLCVRAVPERVAVAASESVPHFSVLVGLKAPPLSEDAMQRAPIDLVTVLDVSSSMNGSKLALLKRAVNFVIDNLGPWDRLSVVSFSTLAQRIFPLRRMTERGREDAKLAVSLLLASGMTDIVNGLAKGVQVLEERQHRNPVASIIFLSDGCDTCHHSLNPSVSGSRQLPWYPQFLPDSVRPSNEGQGQRPVFPVHSFGFGSDHDPLVMHDISDSSGGTFSFIESYDIVQDAFASCIGGLLSVVAQDLNLMVRSCTQGVKIKSISTGRYTCNIMDDGSEGMIYIGYLYADEEKEFLVQLSVPMHTNDVNGEHSTTLLRTTCSYMDALSRETVDTDATLVNIRRPDAPLPSETTMNLEVDRQVNRHRATASIVEAQLLADTGDMVQARSLLSGARSSVVASPAGLAGDKLCMSIHAEMQEIEARMESVGMYHRSGRAYMLSNMSSHGYQRATTRGRRVSVSAAPDQNHALGQDGSTEAVLSPSFVAYGTPQMARMVGKSQQLDYDLM